MLGGYRIAILALGLILSCGLGQAQEQANPGESAAPAQEQPPPPLPVPLPVQIIEDDESANARQRREAEAAQREKDDLLAQQGMNAATQAMNDVTQRMALYSLISTTLVALGTGLLFWTLQLTRDANRSAREAVKVTSIIGEKQVQAYVSVTDTKLVDFLPRVAPKITFWVQTAE